MAAPLVDREARLPRWAQDEFRRLRMRLSEAEARLDEEVASAADSDTWIDRYATHPRPLGKGERVLFTWDGIDGFRWIEAHATRDGLKVMGAGPLVIEPQVTNVFTARLARD